MLEVRSLSKIFSDKKLFENVNLKFVEGHTYGIIGANGAGKSTFLKILSKQMEPSLGEVYIEPNNRISVLSQDQNMYDDYSVTDVVIMGNDVLYKIQKEKNDIYMNPNATEEDYTKASELEEQFGNMGGWNAENDAQILLDSLGIAKDKWNIQMKDLKAGEKVKVLLAKAIFMSPDILIMDEPTNHLDLKSIKWLENFLINYPNIVIVVSHDSDFLDQICTNIVDIDFGEAKMFTGNYSFWKQSSELIRDMQKNSNSKKEEQILKLQEFIAKFSANASKSSQATSRKKALEKITLDEIKPSSRKYPFIRFDIFQRQGKQILEVENLSYTSNTGEVLFSNLSFSLQQGEKMVILGEDDIAKTKLLEILMGIEKPTSGKVIWGSTIIPSYFPSNNDEFFTKEESIMEWISKWPLDNSKEENKENSDQRMRNFLGRMLFSGDSVFKNVKVTSGGEKARLMFSRMMLQESNFLIFDQPLDHLDTESIDSVIEGLRVYDSSLIFTTYNRAFVKQVSNVILEIKPDSSFIFRGTLDEYEEVMGY